MTSDSRQEFPSRRLLAKYGFYLLVIAILVVTVEPSPSTWISAQVVTAILGGSVLVWVITYGIERTAIGRSLEETFQNHRLFVSILVVSLLVAAGSLLSSVLEPIASMVFVAFLLGIFGGIVLFDGISYYRNWSA